MAEINHYGDVIIGAIAVGDIVEGRMVHMTSQSVDNDFGSNSDLPGAKLPATSAIAARARYMVIFAQDNRSLPIYQSQPSFSWALRQGWDQATNAPFNPTLVYITHPGNQEGLTIYSGSACLLFGEGEYTVPSGAYIYSATIEIPGTPLAPQDIATSAANAGKLKVTDTTSVVAEVVHYDSTTGKLTFKILH
jgi:hypothetical protein